MNNVYALAGALLISASSSVAAQVSSRVEVSPKKPAIYDVVCHAVVIRNDSSTDKQIEAGRVTIERFDSAKDSWVRAPSVSSHAYEHRPVRAVLKPGEECWIERWSYQSGIVKLAGRFRVRGFARVGPLRGWRPVGPDTREAVESPWKVYERMEHAGNAKCTPVIPPGTQLADIKWSYFKIARDRGVVAESVVDPLGFSCPVGKLPAYEASAKAILDGAYSDNLKMSARYVLGGCCLAFSRGGPSKEHYVGKALTVLASQPVSPLKSGGIPGKIGALYVRALIESGRADLARVEEGRLASLYPESSLFPCKWKKK